MRVASLVNPLIFSMIILILPFAVIAMPATAKEMGLKAVIEAVIASHPDLEISRIERQIAQTESRRVEGMLDPVVTARIGASEDTTPTSSSFQPSATRLGQISGGIAKPLESGGKLGANFNYSRTSQDYPQSPLTAQLSSFNPAYRNQINLNYRHPLLKGKDRPDYFLSLVVSEAGVRVADMQHQVAARILALKATNAWFQLASDDISIRIAERAAQRARDLLDYQYVRERFGLIETADRLQVEALLSARITDLQRAHARRAGSLSNLNRLMLRAPGQEIAVRNELITEITIPSMQRAIEVAENQRVELKLLQAQMEIADAQLTILRSDDDMQVDLVAEVGTRALDTRAVGAATGGFSTNDHYASLSVELNEVLGRNSARAAIQKSELQRQRIAAQREVTLEQITSDLASAITSLRNGSAVLQATRKQAEAEKRKFTAEMKRYREGRSDTATLVQFEGDLLIAELNADLQALTLQLANKQLLWAEGNLLESLQIDIAGTGSNGQ